MSTPKWTPSEGWWLGDLDINGNRRECPKCAKLRKKIPALVLCGECWRKWSEEEGVY